MLNNFYSYQNNNNVPLQYVNMIGKFNSHLDTPMSNDIILHCKGFYFKVNHDIGITNSRLLQTWSVKMTGRGFIIDLSDCKKEAVEIVVQLFKNTNEHVQQKLILDVYRVLIKLECYLLEENFYTYINQSLLMRGTNNNNLSCLSNNQFSRYYADTKKDNSSIRHLQELTSEIKAMHKSINNFTVQNNHESKRQKKSLNDLPDVGMNDKVVNIKLLTGQKILNYNDYQEIFDLLDFYKSKTSFDKTMISSNEYSNLKLLFDNEIYEIKCLMDLKNVAKYIKRIYNKYEKRPIFNSDNSIRIKPISSNIFNGTNAKKYNESRPLFHKEQTSKSFKKGNYLKRSEKLVPTTIKPLNLIKQEILKEQSELESRSNQLNTFVNTVPFNKLELSIKNKDVDKKNVHFKRNHYTFSSEISNNSDTQIKTPISGNEESSTSNISSQSQLL
uniref:BTB domain-containing protein n=1 Tax=Strongyloides papillosus TaxID=174720 RepID=A0A0N5BF51_STREA